MLTNGMINCRNSIDLKVYCLWAIILLSCLSESKPCLNIKGTSCLATGFRDTIFGCLRKYQVSKH